MGTQVECQKILPYPPYRDSATLKHPEGLARGWSRISGLYFHPKVKMPNSSLFTPTEQSAIVLAAFEAQTDKQVERLLSRLERIFLDKLCASAEAERLLGLTKNS